ncbi:HAMP domain-containing protein [candidate division KSB3 bacterium]|uniref:HAMP domain-containing protein n=1 Tax=candidate division KSB3 bacterium TaxID=2044937 RepID=A0A9D5JXP0_9BACT|nr:HAMP domain-containing protein [candidate division KSB3 bacterium]MBD3326153.1 HAMP domain-containing protein [candidate division KSB3 bacterium]
MLRLNLRTKILCSVGLIVLIVLGTSTLIHIRDLRQTYLEAIHWRSDALAQSILNEITDIYRFVPNLPNLLQGVSLQCAQLYESHKGKDLTHIAVINMEGQIVAHNDTTMKNTPVESPLLLEQIHKQIPTTVLDGAIYHTLIPIFGTQAETYLGTIDIGFPKAVVDDKIHQILFNSAELFLLFLLIAFLMISLLMHVLISKPVDRLVTVGKQLAAGNLIHTFQTASRGDEIGAMGTVFNRIANYLQDVAQVAASVANGILDEDVRVRSEHDALGKAIQDMLNYLRDLAHVATTVADGDLTPTIHIRSVDDTLGRVIYSMTEGLRTLILQIRISAEQIAATGATISSFADHDIGIVRDVHGSIETMITTMQHMGSSVEEVAQNMDTLSDSMEDTSGSVSQMTNSITNIATNTTALTHQTQETTAYLQKTIDALEEIVQNMEGSKYLSQNTIQDALAGQEAVEQVMQSMETIQQTITTAVDRITLFAKRSQDIDTILDVIREITEQTSLLSLNASIIAAQAGEHGRGFGVIAEEIKNLAEGVGTSTKDIAAIVQALRKDTDNVVHTIHEEVSNVNQGMERTRQARSTLEKIISSVQRSSGLVNEIAETLHALLASSQRVSQAMEQVDTMTDDITQATTKQQAVTEQINKAIEQITTMASSIQKATTDQLTGVRHVLGITQDIGALMKQNLSSSQQIVETTDELSAQAAILLQSVDRFKLNAP